MIKVGCDFTKIDRKKERRERERERERERDRRMKERKKEERKKERKKERIWMCDLYLDMLLTDMLPVKICKYGPQKRPNIATDKRTFCMLFLLKQ